MVELGRSYSNNSAPKNLIQIPVAHWEASFGAYIKDKNIKIDSWESFSNKNLKIECIDGIKLCETTLLKYAKKENISIITKPIQGLRKLALNRSDVFIFTKLGVKKLLENNEFKNSGIFYSITLHKESAFPYLHKKWDFLVPELTEVLKQMKEEGLFLKYKKLGWEVSKNFKKE